jgi:hypothetical protein
VLYVDAQMSLALLQARLAAIAGSPRVLRAIVSFDRPG